MPGGDDSKIDIYVVIMWPLVFMRQTNSLHIQKMFFFLQSDHPYSSVGIEIVTYPTLPLHIIAKYFVFQ